MKILMSIPGVGFTTAAAIIAEIGNINKINFCPGMKKLIACRVLIKNRVSYT